jgi:hypothetical protein
MVVPFVPGCADMMLLSGFSFCAIPTKFRMTNLKDMAIFQKGPHPAICDHPVEFSDRNSLMASCPSCRRLLLVPDLQRRINFFMTLVLVDDWLDTRITPITRAARGGGRQSTSARSGTKHSPEKDC